MSSVKLPRIGSAGPGPASASAGDSDGRNNKVVAMYESRMRGMQGTINALQAQVETLLAQARQNERSILLATLHQEKRDLEAVIEVLKGALTDATAREWLEHGVPDHVVLPELPYPHPHPSGSGSGADADADISRITAGADRDVNSSRISQHAAATHRIAVVEAAASSEVEQLLARRVGSSGHRFKPKTREELAAEMGGLTEKLALARTMVARVEAALDEERRLRGAAEAEVLVLQQRLGEQEAVLARYAERIHALEDRLRSARGAAGGAADKAATAALHQQHMAALAELESKAVSVAERYRESSVLVSRLQSQLTNSEKELSKAAAEAVSAREECIKLMSNVQEAEAATATAKSEAAAAVAALEKERAAAAAAAAASAQQLADGTAAAKQEAQSAAQAEMMASLASQIEAALAGVRAEAAEDIATLRASHARDLAEAREAQAAAAAEKEQLQQALSQAEARAASAEAAAASQPDNSGSAELVASLQSEVERLRVKLAAAEESAARAADTLAARGAAPADSPAVPPLNLNSAADDAAAEEEAETIASSRAGRGGVSSRGGGGRGGAGGGGGGREGEGEDSSMPIPNLHPAVARMASARGIGSMLTLETRIEVLERELAAERAQREHEASYASDAATRAAEELDVATAACAQAEARAEAVQAQLEAALARAVAAEEEVARMRAATGTPATPSAAEPEIAEESPDADADF